jgi:hypothetical protein
LARYRHRVATRTDKWIEGIFAGTHGSAWDADGNIMKLVRVKYVARQ